MTTMAEYTLSNADVIDRAKTVQVIVSENDVERAKTRSDSLQDYISKKGYLSAHVKIELEAIPFLPVKQRHCPERDHAETEEKCLVNVGCKMKKMTLFTTIGSLFTLCIHLQVAGPHWHTYIIQNLSLSQTDMKHMYTCFNAINEH